MFIFFLISNFWSSGASGIKSKTSTNGPPYKMFELKRLLSFDKTSDSQRSDSNREKRAQSFPYFLRILSHITPKISKIMEYSCIFRIKPYWKTSKSAPMIRHSSSSADIDFESSLVSRHIKIRNFMVFYIPCFDSAPWLSFCWAPAAASGDDLLAFKYARAAAAVVLIPPAWTGKELFVTGKLYSALPVVAVKQGWQFWTWVTMKFG